MEQQIYLRKCAILTIFVKVKAIKVIFLLFLVLKSSGGFSISISCCDTKTDKMEVASDIEGTSNHEDEDGCCGGQCDCLCCGHVFTYEEVLELTLTDTRFTNGSVTDYIQPTYSSYLDRPWQPPRRS